MKYALIGCGRVAPHHIKAAKDNGFEIAAVCDIRGGNNAGIKTCWYNPDHLPARPGFRIDYTISDLREVLDIL